MDRLIFWYIRFFYTSVNTQQIFSPQSLFNIIIAISSHFGYFKPTNTPKFGNFTFGFRFSHDTKKAQVFAS